MASDKAAAGQTGSTRRAKNPVDIALNAGMRPMLMGHGFQRRTKRYFDRETANAVQYVAISPPDPRVGYLNCMYDASAGIVSKELSKISRDLNLNNSLFIYVRCTSHQCHLECQLEDIDRFNARLDVKRIKNTPFFLRLFTKTPMIRDHIPEMKEFESLCKNIGSFPSSPLASERAENYAIQYAQLFEKYVLPWFDQCEDANHFAEWIAYWVGRGAKTPNLLLATAYCLASNFEDARTHFENAIALADVSFDKIYRQELRDQNKKKFQKTKQDRKKRAERMAQLIATSRKRRAEDARALARYFDIDLG